MQKLKIILCVMALALTLAPARSRAVVETAVYPIVDVSSGCLLGGSRGGKWLKAEETAASLGVDEQYRLYDLSGEVATRTGAKPESQGAPCDETLYVKFQPETTGARHIAVGGQWNPMPRKPTLLDPNNAVYRDAVAEVLKKNGIRNPQVELSKIVRVDLDGDGVDEVIVSATRVARMGEETGGNISTNSNAGDYSLVMLRKVVKGKVQTIVLDGQYHPKAAQGGAPNEYELTAVLDLNGDGVMEIIVNGGYYEGDWMTVYSIEGNKATDVLTCGCGA